MILGDHKITAAIERGEIVIDPFDAGQIQPASYDLRVGHQGVTTSGKKVLDVKTQGYLALEPGDFAFVVTLESIQLDLRHTARLGLRSKYARKGLIATTGLQIDPGFHGRLMVGLSNLSPQVISMPYKDDFLSIEIHELEEPVKSAYQGPYSGRAELGPDEISSVVEGTGMAFSEVLNTVATLSKSTDQLNKTVDRLTTDVSVLVGEMRNFKWYFTGSMAVFGAVIAAVGIVIAAKF